jgi:hypothetical protein
LSATALVLVKVRAKGGGNPLVGIGARFLLCCLPVGQSLGNSSLNLLAALFGSGVFASSTCLAFSAAGRASSAALAAAAALF